MSTSAPVRKTHNVPILDPQHIPKYLPQGPKPMVPFIPQNPIREPVRTPGVPIREYV